MISIYADGSSNGGKKGAVGYGWIITDWERIIIAGSGGRELGTNNQGELLGAISGLEDFLRLELKGCVELVSDSQYCLGVASGKYVAKANLELVEYLKRLMHATQATVRWVRGHSGEPLNEKADALALRGRLKYSNCHD